MTDYTIEDARKAGWSEDDAPGFVAWMNEFIAALREHEIDWGEWDFDVANAYEEGVPAKTFANTCISEVLPDIWEEMA